MGIIKNKTNNNDQKKKSENKTTLKTDIFTVMPEMRPYCMHEIRNDRKLRI